MYDLSHKIITRSATRSPTLSLPEHSDVGWPFAVFVAAGKQAFVARSNPALQSCGRAESNLFFVGRSEIGHKIYRHVAVSVVPNPFISKKTSSIYSTAKFAGMRLAVYSRLTAGLQERLPQGMPLSLAQMNTTAYACYSAHNEEYSDAESNTASFHVSWDGDVIIWLTTMTSFAVAQVQ